MMESRVLDVLDDRALALGPKPDAASPYRNFKLTRDSDGIAWLLFDRAETSANTLSADVIEELDLVLAALESQRPAGIVIRSAKSSGFGPSSSTRSARTFMIPESMTFPIPSRSASHRPARRRCIRWRCRVWCPIASLH